MAAVFQYCTTCGYNFEGLDGPEFCPECGTRPDQRARDLARCWYDWRTTRGLLGHLQRAFPPRVTAARLGKERVGYQHVSLPRRWSLHAWAVYVPDVGAVVYFYTLGYKQLERAMIDAGSTDDLDVSVIVCNGDGCRAGDQALLEDPWERIHRTVLKMHRSQHYLLK